ncbi:RCC1-like domain-containing protein [Plantactinospora sp. DSM 117369]
MAGLLTGAGLVAGLAVPAAAATAGTDVLSWGENNDFQLGNGTRGDRNRPGPVSVPEGVTFTDVAGGQRHGLAVSSDGLVYAWGANGSGQVGDGSTSVRPTPVQVLMPSEITTTAVAAGFAHSLALTSTGQVYAWGWNSEGQLGTGAPGGNSSTPAPVQLPTGTTVTDIAAHGDHSLALTSTGQVLAWGDNSQGQLGDGTTTDRHTATPVSLPAGTTVTDIGAGSFHSLAIISTGQALAWGRNAEGQLGRGTVVPEVNPVPAAVWLPPGVTVTKIEGGYYSSYAITFQGRALAWGYNFFGDLGSGTDGAALTPVWVALPAGVTVTDLDAGRHHALALTSTGRTLGWGENNHGQLGNGTLNLSRVPVWVDLPTNTKATAVAAGNFFSLAVVASGLALGWGANDAGQIGNGTITDRALPVAMAFPAGRVLTSIEGGYSHSLAATSTGKAYAWGSNSDGQLGTGDTSDRDSPTQVLMPSGTTTVAVAGGAGHSLALTSDGRVFAWGRNNSGQLGLGDTNRRLTPVQVTFPAGTVITAIAVHNVHNVALTSIGQIYTWGDNTFGQIGDGTATDRRTPTLIPLPGGAATAAVAAGAFHTLAMTSTGGAYAWGYNNYGQLGNASTTNSSIPVAVGIPAGTTITDIDAGLSHSLAITDTGRALAWGANASGQLGNSTTTHSSLPVSVWLPPGVSINTISGGQSHSLAVTDGGRVLAWGLNNRGQLGDGTLAARLTPVYAQQPTGTIATEVAGGRFHSLAR